MLIQAGIDMTMIRKLIVDTKTGIETYTKADVVLPQAPPQQIIPDVVQMQKDIEELKKQVAASKP